MGTETKRMGTRVTTSQHDLGRLHGRGGIELDLEGRRLGLGTLAIPDRRRA